MSLTAEDLKAISDLMDKKFDEKLSPINQRLDKMGDRLDKIEERLEIIEESAEEVRGSMEEVLGWFSTYQRTDKDKPFPARESDIQLQLKMSELKA